MPDRRTQRGPHPKDAASFAEERLPTLRRATSELSWLLTRGYSYKAALKLVGDRYLLRDRQRQALQRCAASDDACRRRGAHRLDAADASDEPLLVDGYNVLLTVEAAMSGGLVLGARDGTFRDLAAMNRHYRQVLTTEPALAAIGSSLESTGRRQTVWLLDRPISNSGRLRRVIEATASEHGWNWRVELVPNPDPILRDSEHPVATADSGILDRCERWLNLARWVIERCVENAWIVDLGEERAPAR